MSVIFAISGSSINSCFKNVDGGISSMASTHQMAGSDSFSSAPPNKTEDFVHPQRVTSTRAMGNTDLVVILTTETKAVCFFIAHNFPV